jgi:hypothetical protein
LGTLPKIRLISLPDHKLHLKQLRFRPIYPIPESRGPHNSWMAD